MNVKAELDPEQELRIEKEARSAGMDPDIYWSTIIDGLAEARMAEMRLALFSLRENTVIGQRRREIEDLLRNIAESAIPKTSAPPGTPEERLAAYRAWIADHESDTAVPTRDAYDRDNLYEDRL